MPTAHIPTAAPTFLGPTGPFYFSSSVGGCRLKDINDPGEEGKDYKHYEGLKEGECKSKCADIVECKAFESNGLWRCEIWTSTPGFVDSSEQKFECGKKISDGSAV